jgi:phosphate:Na+ symporter
MDMPFDIWQFLAGLGIFLLGMKFVEDALRRLAGRSFKRFLRKQTTHPLKGVLSGTVITALLQSSSVVTLMVLAFVGAEIISLRNALGVIFGSNLGTTFTGWIVATLGFKLDIESFALPFIAFGGMTYIFFSKKERVREMGRFLIGFGFIFLGLEYMKSSIDYLTQTFDLSPYVDFHPYVFAVVGLILTALIQSSSASMVIVLSALNAEIIPLPAAAAMVIGSDLGTTITVLIGGLGGTAVKKRVALSHLLFNLIADVTALALMYPLLYLLTNIFGMTDPLLTLVAFHSSFNLIGIFLMLPFLGLFVRFLENRFADDDASPVAYIGKVPTDVPDAALEALGKEIQHLLHQVFAHNLKLLQVPTALFPFPEPPNKSFPFFQSDQQEHYNQLKQLEGEIVEFYLRLQSVSLTEEESAELNESVHSVRNAMMAAKGTKDILHNLKDFRQSANESINGLSELLKGQQNEWYLALHRLLGTKGKKVSQFETLADLARRSQQLYDQFTKEVYQQAQNNQLTEQEISTLLNVNREIYNVDRSLLMAVKDSLLSPEKAKDFNLLPDLH